MKATLIIRHIEKLYTCDSQDTICTHAFVACHHDRILECGPGDGSRWQDEATRIIDAAGEIVVPAFIETQYDMPRRALYNEMLRQERDRLWQMYHNGILTVLTTAGRIQQRTLYQDVFRARKGVIAQVKFGDKAPRKEPFVLTCAGPGDNRSLQPAAFYQRHIHHVDSLTLLKASTCWPAQAARLDDRGIIAPGKLADMLVLRVPDIDGFYELADTTLIRRIIKNGIPVYPEIIRC